VAVAKVDLPGDNRAALRVEAAEAVVIRFRWSARC
jgi:hypothetical protein